MAKGDEELEKRLEKAAIELDLGRSLFNSLQERNEKLSEDIKGILARLKKRDYQGERIDVTLKPKSYPYQVNPKIAGEHVPYKEFLEMISVSKGKFEAYLTSKDIKLKPEEYLTSPGTYDVVCTKVKLPVTVVKQRFKDLYNIFVNLVTSKKRMNNGNTRNAK
jgi:hypothetical protein